MQSKMTEIERRYTRVDINPLALIAKGQGRFKGEAAVRQCASDIIDYSPFFSASRLVDLFEIDRELKEAHRMAADIEKQKVRIRDKLRALESSAYDAVFLDTEEKLYEHIKKLEDFKA